MSDETKPSCETCSLWQPVTSLDGFGICKQRTDARTNKVDPMIKIVGAPAYATIRTDPKFYCNQYKA